MAREELLQQCQLQHAAGTIAPLAAGARGHARGNEHTDTTRGDALEIAVVGHVRRVPLPWPRDGVTALAHGTNSHDVGPVGKWAQAAGSVLVQSGAATQHLHLQGLRNAVHDIPQARVAYGHVHYCTLSTTSGG